MAEFHPLRGSTDGGSVEWEKRNKEAERRAKNCTPAAMPTLNHAKMADYQHVYEPSDDTYLLLDGILADLVDEEQQDANNPLLVLEIGTGSGVPITYLTQQLRQRKIPCNPMATDINPDAIHFARMTAEENGISDLQLIQCDLATPLLEKLQHKVDILLFNPPYVPTPNEEVAGNSIEASWAGGDKGRLVIDRALPQIAQLLKKESGKCYMITVDDNEPEEMARILETDYSLKMEPFVRRRAHNEYLTVQKIAPIIGR